MSPKLPAKLKLASEINAFLAAGCRGADLALDSDEWCPLLGHLCSCCSESWAKNCDDLLKWAREAYPELTFKLTEDERGRDPRFTSCCWHLSVKTR